MNELWLYLLNSAAWSGVGFAAGWAMAREWRREQAEHDRDDDA